MNDEYYSFQEAAQISFTANRDMREFYEKETSKPHLKDAAEKITCQKGCGACCHYGLISCSSIEAFSVLVSLLGEGTELSALNKIAVDYVNEFIAARNAIGNLPFSHASRLQFLKKRVPCPFLGADEAPQGSEESFGGSCQIYSHRPLICRLYNSTENPKKCASLQKHAVAWEAVSTGENCTEALREFERQQFGKSALGHFPLIFAAMTTERGLRAFLRKDALNNHDKEPDLNQEERDFFFYVELLDSLGIQLTEEDYSDLELAQTE